MPRPSLARRVWPGIGAAAVVLLLSDVARAEPPGNTQEALASHFRTAPEAVPPQMQLVQIFVNGVDAGLHQIIVSSGTVSLPAATLAALRIAGVAGDPLVLTGRADIGSQFDEAKSRLDLTVPIAMLGPNRLDLGHPGSDLALSPETWGAYVNYDVNARRGFGGTTNGTGTIGAGAGMQWGGLFDLNALAPDFIGHNSWAYDSARNGQPLVRLDNNLTWRPAWPRRVQGRRWRSTTCSPAWLVSGCRPLSLGAALEGRWTGFRFRLGPWRWLIVVYAYLEEDDRVVVVTIVDGRTSRSPTAAD